MSYNFLFVKNTGNGNNSIIIVTDIGQVPDHHVHFLCALSSKGTRKTGTKIYHPKFELFLFKIA